MKKGGSRSQQRVDRLLFSAMIEARSCERFKVLSEHINDTELASFYHELMVSEATHYATFIRLARKYADGIDVDKRWAEYLAYEAQVIKNYGKKETLGCHRSSRGLLLLRCYSLPHSEGSTLAASRRKTFALSSF